MSAAIFGMHAVFSLLEKNLDNIEEILLQDNYKKNRNLTSIFNTAKEHRIKVTAVPRKQLDDLCSKANHQGVVCLTRKPLNQYSENDLKSILENIDGQPLLLILDQITDPHNLGACLRTAAAAGVQAVIAPKDGSASLTPVAAKISCGAADTLPYVQVTNLSRTMKMLQERGIWITGTSLDANTNIYQADFKGAVAIVIGGEGSGMRRLVKENCDFLAKIPIPGEMESLNASVAAGVCLFEAVRQRSASK